MTKGEEAGMVAVVLLLLASACTFAFGMGKSMGEIETRLRCDRESVSVPILPPEDTK